MSNLVFVYGTLKKGNWNNCLLERAKFVGEAVTCDPFLMTTVGFPYMIPKEMVSRSEVELLPVRGEVYEVADALTRLKLDNLEGVSSGHYKRTKILVTVGETVKEVLAYTPCDPCTQNYTQLTPTKDGYYEF